NYTLMMLQQKRHLTRPACLEFARGSSDLHSGVCELVWAIVERCWDQQPLFRPPIPVVLTCIRQCLRALEVQQQQPPAPAKLVNEERKYLKQHLQFMVRFFSCLICSRCSDLLCRFSSAMMRRQSTP